MQNAMEQNLIRFVIAIMEILTMLIKVATIQMSVVTIVEQGLDGHLTILPMVIPHMPQADRKKVTLGMKQWLGKVTQLIITVQTLEDKNLTPMV